MKLLNNIKAWKSTLLGLILIAADLFYLYYKDDTELTIFVILLVTGIGLLFVPDTLLSGLRAFITKNQNKEV